MIRMNMKGKSGSPGNREQAERRAERVDPKTLVGKHAFTAVVTEDGYVIGRADFGTPGYTPLKVAPYVSFEEAKAAADQLNDSLGLTRLCLKKASCPNNQPPAQIIRQARVTASGKTPVFAFAKRSLRPDSSKPPSPSQRARSAHRSGRSIALGAGARALRALYWARTSSTFVSTMPLTNLGSTRGRAS